VQNKMSEYKHHIIAVVLTFVAAVLITQMIAGCSTAKYKKEDIYKSKTSYFYCSESRVRTFTYLKNNEDPYLSDRIMKNNERDYYCK
jgi:hypothetical protein